MAGATSRLLLLLNPNIFEIYKRSSKQCNGITCETCNSHRLDWLDIRDEIYYSQRIHET